MTEVSSRRGSVMRALRLEFVFYVRDVAWAVIFADRHSLADANTYFLPAPMVSTGCAESLPVLLNVVDTFKLHLDAGIE